MTTPFSEIRVGTTFRTSSRTLREADIVGFAGLSGDFNPLHMDEVWVRQNTEFKGVIAHGILVTAAGSGLRCPEIDQWHIVAYLGIERRFVAPAYPGDTIHQRCEVREVRPSRSQPENGIVTVHIEIANHNDEVLQVGTDTYLVGTPGVGS